MSDFRFESPNVFFWLWLIPILVGVTFYLNKQAQGKLQKALGAKLLPYLASSVSHKKRRLKLILEMLVLTLMIIAMARPQSGEGRQKVKNEGIEIVFLVDASRGMAADDIKPSRLAFAISELKRLVDLSGGDRFGLVGFAYSAVLMSPMTPDQSAVKMFLESLTTQSVSTQGTYLSRALDEAKEAFKRGGVDDDNAAVTKVIIVATDGEDHEQGAIDTAAKLAQEGIHVFVLGVGTEQGSPIPEKDDHNQVRGFHRDRSGQVVVTKMNPQMLRELAAAGKGSFHHATFQNDAVAELRADLEKLQKSQFADGEIKIYQELFQPLLILALLLALIEIILGERNPSGRIWKGRFEVSQS
jgi:Ca-activated chloride channel homolog